MKQQLINLGNNHAGAFRFKSGVEVNYGSIRVQDEDFVHYTRKGLDEMFKQGCDPALAKDLKSKSESELIGSGHIAVTPIAEIAQILF